ncbi:MAG: hypothetical protein KAT68_07610 [Bacteroidales bacterium]|nr:hypothetical protein [Bacteroidales bacterium]
MIDKLKVIHIHTDYKFINNSNFFNGKYFENRIVIIERDKPYSGPFRENATFLKNTKHDIDQIIKICKDADLVVFYELELIKEKIALRLPKYVKIAWRFFGYELYGKQRDIVLSKKTKQALRINYSKNPFKIFKVFFRKIKTYFSLFIFSGSPNILFYRASLRVNFFLALSFEEYNYLSSYYKLPVFIKLPFKNKIYNENVLHTNLTLKRKEKFPIIIVGNSRSEYNNHLDIIDLIDKNRNKEKYNFTLLLNYGSEKKYTSIVRQNIIRKKYFKTIEDFMSIEDFKLLYKKTSALVINSYRQMAGANVLEGFQNGVKIYLNEKNVMLQWFKNEGFYIFTIEDFEDDLKNDNIFLTQEEAQYNIHQYRNLSKKYTVDEFQQILYNKIKFN